MRLLQLNLNFTQPCLVPIIFRICSPIQCIESSAVSGGAWASVTWMASADCDFLKWVLVLWSPTVDTNKYNGPTAEDWPFDGWWCCCCGRWWTALIYRSLYYIQSDWCLVSTTYLITSPQQHGTGPDIVKTWRMQSLLPVHSRNGRCVHNV